MLPELKLAYYRKKDWNKLMRSIVDRESMHANWFEWYKEYNESKARLEEGGFTIHEMTIKIDELNQFCAEKGLKNSGETRSKYVVDLPLTYKRKKFE